MQEICSSNPPVVTGICDPSKSRAQHHRNYFLAVLELCAFYIKYKNVKFTAINLGRASVKYADTAFTILKIPKKVRPLLEITIKSTQFLLSKQKIPIPWIEL